MSAYKIIDLTPENLTQYDLFCYKSKHKTSEYQQKVDWFNTYYSKGLRLKILYVDEDRSKLTSRGFIEYIPGEYNWRGIKANGFLVIHCLFIVGKQKRKGYASMLIDQCIDEAKKFNGLVVATSTRNWLVSPKIFK